MSMLPEPQPEPPPPEPEPGLPPEEPPVPKPGEPIPRQAGSETRHDWNVVVCVREGGFNRARRLLREFGPVRTTGFLNLLVMRVNDPKQLLEALAAKASTDPEFFDCLGRVVPVSSTFTLRLFQQLNDEGLTIVLVTHDAEVAGHARRIIRIRDGRIEGSTLETQKSEFELFFPGCCWSSRRVVGAEHSRLVIVSEQLGIPSPANHGPQRLLRVALVEMVLKQGSSRGAVGSSTGEDRG